MYLLFSSRRRHTRWPRDWSSDVCSSDLVKEVLPTYDENSEEVDGRIILRDNFDYILNHRAETVIFGEDSGTIGDVNQRSEERRCRERGEISKVEVAGDEDDTRAEHGRDT